MENQKGGQEEGEGGKTNAAPATNSDNESTMNSQAATNNNSRPPLTVDDCPEDPKITQPDLIAKTMKQQRLQAKNALHADLILVGEYFQNLQKGECTMSPFSALEPSDDSVDREFEEEIARFNNGRQNESGFSSGGPLSNRSPCSPRNAPDYSSGRADRLYATLQNESASSRGWPMSPRGYVADDTVDREFNAEVERVYRAQRLGDTTLSSPGCPLSRGIPDDTIDREFNAEVKGVYRAQRQGDTTLSSPGCPLSRGIPDDTVDREFNAEVESVYRANRLGDTTLSSPGCPLSRGIPDDTVDRLFQDQVDRHYRNQLADVTVASSTWNRTLPKLDFTLPSRQVAQGGSCPRGRAPPPRSPRPPPAKLQARGSPRQPPVSPRSPNTTAGSRRQERTFNKDESNFPPFTPSSQRTAEDTLDLMYNEGQRKFEALVAQNQEGKTCPRVRPPASPAARPPLSPLKTPRQGPLSPSKMSPGVTPRTSPRSPNLTPRTPPQLSLNGTEYLEPPTSPAAFQLAVYQVLDKVFQEANKELIRTQQIDTTGSSRGRPLTPPARPQQGQVCPRKPPPSSPDSTLDYREVDELYKQLKAEGYIDDTMSSNNSWTLSDSELSPQELQAHLVRKAEAGMKGGYRRRPPTPISPPSEAVCPRRPPTSPRYQAQESEGLPAMSSTPLAAPRREDVRQGGPFFNFSPQTVDLYRRHDELLQRQADIYRQQYNDGDSRDC